jgi:hypothetical protein
MSGLRRTQKVNLGLSEDFSLSKDDRTVFVAFGDKDRGRFESELLYGDPSPSVDG